MRHIHILSGSSLFACLLAFCGCSTDELPGTEPTDGIGSTAPFTITVSDGGYASPDGNPHTRATENGYRTDFTAGDQIGVFAVKNGEIVSGVSNLCLTAAGEGSNIVWKAAGVNGLSRYDKATYYAYYPYRKELTGNPVPTAADAAGFFADIIASWTPSTDQGTYASYTAQDLMTAQGKRTGNSLSFSMTHCMALVVIDLPRTKYTFNGHGLQDYFLAPPAARFSDFSPYRMNASTYRYLLNPTTANGPLNGSYTDRGSTKAWSFSPSSVNAGKYKVFQVEGEIVSHTLQAGDFYMSDGSLVGKDANLSEAQKKACVGVVFWVGDATAKDKTLTADHESCTHGLVVALKDASESVAWQSPSASVQTWLNSNRSGVFLPVASNTGAGDPLNNIQGYNNTKAIEAFNADDANSSNVVQAVQKVVDYRNAVSAPATSSGWYLPSEKELTLLCGKEDVTDIWKNQSGGTSMRDLLNGTNGPFNKLGSSSYATVIQTSYYWSSTENDSGHAFGVYFGDGYVGNYYKHETFRVRCVLAF